jgi:hypothetical protein
MVVGLGLVLRWSTTASISASETKQPWMRLALRSRVVEKSMSPWPTSFSAPGLVEYDAAVEPLATLNAIRFVMLALMSPVTTFAPGAGWPR